MQNPMIRQMFLVTAHIFSHFTTDHSSSIVLFDWLLRSKRERKVGNCVPLLCLVSWYKFWGHFGFDLYDLNQKCGEIGLVDCLIGYKYPYYWLCAT